MMLLFAEMPLCVHMWQQDALGSKMLPFKGCQLYLVRYFIVNVLTL